MTKHQQESIEHISLVPEFPQNSQTQGYKSYREFTDFLQSTAQSNDGILLGIMRANWHPQISNEEIKGAKDFLSENFNFNSKQTLKIAVFNVSGTLELPLLMKHLLAKHSNLPLIALGVIIRGETAHFDIVCNTSNQALMDIAVAHSLAFGNGLLTCETMEQAQERAYQKGRDAVHAALNLMAHYHQFETKNCVEVSALDSND